MAHVDSPDQKAKQQPCPTCGTIHHAVFEPHAPPHDPLAAEAAEDEKQQKTEALEARIVELEAELTALRAEVDRISVSAVVIFPGSGEPIIDALRRYARTLESQVERLENPSSKSNKDKEPKKP